MTLGRFARPLAHATVAALMIFATATRGSAQSHDDHDHASATAAQAKPTPEQNALVQAVRANTERFKNVTDVAGPGEGYALNFGCVSGGEFGAMGLHYVNMSFVGDKEIDVTKPEIILFEPTRDGRIRITGADFVVIAADWDATHDGPPQLNGQLFHFFDAPNRFGLPPFYTLHVWAWKENPNGTFTNWNPNVSCDGFNPQ